MQDLTLRSSIQSKRFVIKRIGESDLEINNTERMAILKALNEGVKFVQVRDYTLMLNGIKSIEPVEIKAYNFKIPEFTVEKPMTQKERKQARDSLLKVREIFWTKRIGGGDNE